MNGPLSNHTPTVPVNLPPQSGVFLGPSWITASGTVVTMVADQLEAMPFYVGKALTVDQISLQITTAAAVGGTFGKMKLGIYRDNGAGYPGALLLDAGEITTLTTTGLKAIAIALTLQPGWYWLVMAADWDYTTAPQCRSGTAPSDGSPLGFNTGNPNAASTVYTHYEVAWTYPAGANPALPDPFTAAATLVAGNNTTHQVMLRAA